MSDSDTDSDINEYCNIANNFLSVVSKLKENKETTPRKKGVPSPDKKFPDSLKDSELEPIEIGDDSDASATNLDDSCVSNSSKVESPIEIIDEDELTANDRVRRLRSWKKRVHHPKKTSKKSPAKKKVIETKISLLEDDDDDSFCLSQKIEEKEDPNPVILVKVFWRFKQLEKVPIRKFQKISEIFYKFSKLEDVPVSRIQLCLNERILKPDDTPESLNLKITDVLDGGVINAATEVSADSTIENIKRPQTAPPNSIPLKVMRKDIREPVLIRLTKTDNMKIFMIKIAEELNLKENEFKLFFDGDLVDPEDTPESLDLEGNECFELKT